MNSLDTRMTLVSATVGLSNILHDHYMRPQMLDIDPRDVDILMEAKLGDTGKISPATLMEVSSRTGGISVQPEDNAYIEDGWAFSRGLCQLEFLLENNALVNEKLVVLGYIAGGSIDYEGGIPGDLMFVPIRVWQIETKSYTEFDGFLSAKSRITRAAQVLLNDNSTDGLHSIRPKDILENATAISATREENSMIGGGDDNWAGSTAGTLAMSGMIFSNVNNNSPTHYASSLLGASMKAGENMRMGAGDQYSSLSDSIGMTTRQEMHLRQNQFMETMRNTLGRTTTTMSGFEGFSFDEIITVFENFADVLNLETADQDRFAVEDSRIGTAEFGSSNRAEIIANELLMLSQYLLFENKLGVLSISGTNDVESSSLEINDLPVEYMPGEMLPITNGLELDYIGTIENIKAQLTNFFFGKYCSEYYHSRQLVSFTAHMCLFGQTEISVVINGDPSTERTLAFSTYALNRFDPNLTSRTRSARVSEGFFDNLVNHFNFQ